MSAAYTVQSTFGKGEITPLAYGRVDVDFFKQSCERCRNFNVLLHGGVRRRSGTRFVAPIANQNHESLVLPFSFNNEQSYVLDINGGGAMRFLANRGYVGAPYTIAHPWADDDLLELSYTQFNDVAYFASRDFEPRKLSRIGETNWTLTRTAFEDGPYLPVNTTATVLTLAATGNAVAQMDSNTSPSPYVASSSRADGDAYKVFARDESLDVILDSGPTGFSKIDLGVSNAKVVDAYWVQGSSRTDGDAPTAWVIEGSNDDSSFVVLDRVGGEAGWLPSERRYFDFVNQAAYRYYRMTFTGGGGDNSEESSLNQIVYHQAAFHQIPFDLTASSTDGINGGSGFVTSDVGRPIRLKGTDERWRWARIVTRTSSTVVTIRLYDQALPDLTPIREWALGAFSVDSGWPGLVELYDERVNFGSTVSKPVTIWGSKQGDFEDFGESNPPLPTDGYSLTFLTSNMNELIWLAADEDLIVGSAKQIRALGPADTAQAFSAVNLTQRKGPTSGAAAVQPIPVGDALLYVAAGARKIRELVRGDQNRYVAPELSLIGEHTLNSGIVWCCFSENPEPTIYAGTEDGNVVAILYDREQRAVGFSVHELGGNGRAESGCVIPSAIPGFDDIYLVVARTINGVAKRYIEVMEHPFHYESDVVMVDDRPTAVGGFFVDCGLTYSGAPATVITGLSHLANTQVMVCADGAVIRDLVVSVSGQLTLPYAASVVHVGLAYESHLRTHRYSGPGQDGYLFGRPVNQTSVYVDLLSTGALEVGAYGDNNWTPAFYEINPHVGEAFTGNPVELVTGLFRADIEGSWGKGNGQIVMKTDAPLPCIIRLVQLATEATP